MKSKLLVSSLIIVSAAIFSNSALAVTMTLENLALDQDDPYTEFGYTIHAPGEHLHAAGNINNLSNAAQMAADTRGMTLVKDDGGLFDFVSMERVTLQGALGAPIAMHIDAYLNGVATGTTATFGSSNTGGLMSFLSADSGWAGIDEVRFWYDSAGAFGNLGTSNFDNFIFDDIIVNASVSAVPVPAAVWLFMSALGGLGAMRKKQAVA